MSELHPALAPLAFLVGDWHGAGAGHYPTIEPFAYLEEISFEHVGKPWLRYSQRTMHAIEGRPLHAETGYWRPVSDAEVEIVMTYPTGHVEVAAGVVQATTIDVETVTIAATPTAKRVDRVVRRFAVDGDDLRYELSMAAVGEALTPHLEAVLHRR